jgi:hypothetical protein
MHEQDEATPLAPQHVNFDRHSACHVGQRGGLIDRQVHGRATAFTPTHNQSGACLDAQLRSPWEVDGKQDV